MACNRLVSLAETDVGIFVNRTNRSFGGSPFGFLLWRINLCFFGQAWISWNISRGDSVGYRYIVSVRLGYYTRRTISPYMRASCPRSNVKVKCAEKSTVSGSPLWRISSTPPFNWNALLNNESSYQKIGIKLERDDGAFQLNWWPAL